VLILQDNSAFPYLAVVSASAAAAMSACRCSLLFGPSRLLLRPLRLLLPVLVVLASAAGAAGAGAGAGGASSKASVISISLQ
jgi:hypothetical protein